MNEKNRILIVEDEFVIAEAMKVKLEKLGYEVCGLVASGAEAIAAAEEKRPDLILMDIMLAGDINGIEAAARIAEQLLVPVIYVTAYTGRGILEQAKVTGPFGYITKPVKEAELHAAIEIALHKARLEQVLREQNTELERRVQERTADLRRANALLQQEIDERIRLAEALRTSQNMLLSIFESISDPLFVLGRDMTVKTANSATLRYYGVTQENVSGKPCHEAFLGREHICTECTMLEKIISGTAKTFERKSPVRQEAHERVTVYPVKGAGTADQGVVVHIQDITRSKLLDNYMEHNERLSTLGILMAGIAHEINNPNNFISFNLPILREYMRGLLPLADRHSEQAPEYAVCGIPYREFRDDLFRLMDNMQHGSARIARTVTGLREFVQGSATRDLVPTDMRGLIDKAITLCGSKLKKEIESFTVALPDNFPQVITDPHALEHILIILLLNAAQAADKSDSWVRLSVTQGRTWQNRIIIEVSDNGCGIAEEHLQKIFEPFFSTKAASGGTGLGMYLCKNMLHALGGSIEVTSRHGEGTTVRLWLPDMCSQ